MRIAKSVRAIILINWLFLITLRADDAVDWVQVHGEVSYTRQGSASTTSTGEFSFRLRASFDQLLARVAPAGGEKWPSFVLLEEYPKVGTASGTVEMTGTGTFDHYSGNAKLSGNVRTLEQVWIESIKPQPILFGPGLSAEIKIAAPLQGTVRADLPGRGSDPATAIFLWPAPVKLSPETNAFVSEGSVYVWPPFGPRPKDQQMGMIYDGVKSIAELNVAGLGSLTAPTATAQLSGGPSQWQLAMTAHASAETGTGGQYTHQVEVVLQLVPRKLPIPKLITPP